MKESSSWDMKENRLELHEIYHSNWEWSKVVDTWE